jgi:hypothetical protein
MSREPVRRRLLPLPPHPPPLPPTTINHLPHMTSKEKDHHIKEGLCFYCHEKGHSALKCPKKNKGTPTAKVAVVAAQEEPKKQEAQVAKIEEVAETAKEDFPKGK